MPYHPFLHSAYEGVVFDCSTDLSRVLEQPFFGLTKLIILDRQGERGILHRRVQKLPRNHLHSGPINRFFYSLSRLCDNFSCSVTTEQQGHGWFCDPVTNDSGMELYRTDPCLWYSDRAFRYGYTWFDTRQIDAFRLGKRIPPPQNNDFPSAAKVLRYDADTSLPPNTAQIALLRSSGQPATPSGPSSASRVITPLVPLPGGRKTASSTTHSSSATRIIPSLAGVGETKNPKKRERSFTLPEWEGAQDFQPEKGTNKRGKTKTKSNVPGSAAPYSLQKRIESNELSETETGNKGVRRSTRKQKSSAQEIIDISECDYPIVPISAAPHRSTPSLPAGPVGGSSDSARDPRVTESTLTDTIRSAPDRRDDGAVNPRNATPASSAALGLWINDTSTTPTPAPSPAGFVLNIGASALNAGASDSHNAISARDIGASDLVIISDTSEGIATNNSGLDGRSVTPGCSDFTSAALNFDDLIVLDPNVGAGLLFNSAALEPNPAGTLILIDPVPNPAIASSTNAPGSNSDTGAADPENSASSDQRNVASNDGPGAPTDAALNTGASAEPIMVSGAPDPNNGVAMDLAADGTSNDGTHAPITGASSGAPANDTASAIDLAAGISNGASASMIATSPGPARGPTGASNGGAVEPIGAVGGGSTSIIPGTTDGASDANSATPAATATRPPKGKQKDNLSGRPPLNAIKKPLILDSTHLAMDSPGSYFYRPPLQPVFTPRPSPSNPSSVNRVVSMGTGGAKATSQFLHSVNAAPIPEALPSIGVRTHAFDAMPEPDSDVVEVFESLTPREAASVYLNVALGPVRENVSVQDAQKALAVVKTLLAPARCLPCAMPRSDGKFAPCTFRGWGQQCGACITGRKAGCTFAVPPHVLGNLVEEIAPWADLEPNTIKSQLYEAVIYAQQAFRQQQLAIESAASCARLLRHALNVSERLSASTPVPTLLHSDPDAFGILRFFLDLSPEDVLRIKQDRFPSILDQPAELDKLMQQLSSWSSEPLSPDHTYPLYGVDDEQMELTKKEEEDSGSDEYFPPSGSTRSKRGASAEASRANKKMRMG